MIKKRKVQKQIFERKAKNGKTFAQSKRQEFELLFTCAYSYIHQVENADFQDTAFRTLDKETL